MNERVAAEPQKIERSADSTPGTTARVLRRKCACGGAGGAGLTGNCSDCDRKRLSRQTRHAPHAAPSRAPRRPSEIGTPPPIVGQVLASSSGEPLDASTRALMESRLGHDFGRVRVHADARAAASAESVNALAYTVGQQVVFGAGQYRPDTRAGRRLLAHELAHTVQQGDGPVGFHGKLEIGSPESDDEREADLAAEAIESPAGVGPKLPGRTGGASSPVLRRKTGDVGSWFRGLFSSLLFGTFAFPDSWLQDYLNKLDETGDIEGDPDSDDKAREIVNTWRKGGSKFVLTARRKALLIKEMLDGPTLWGDEDAILEILERSYNYELSYIFKEGGVTAERLGEDISGGAGDRLREFYEYRFEGGKNAVLAGEIRPSGEPVPLGQELPPVGAQEYIKQYFSGGTTGWDVPCVLGILCTQDRAIIDELPALNVKRLDRIDVTQWVFDGTSWKGKLVHPIGVNRPKEKLVALVNTSSCSTAAQTMFHEVHHQHQPEDKRQTVFTMEVDAYTEAEKWAIERGLPEQPTDLDSPPLRERDAAGKQVPSAAGIEGKVRRIYGGPTPEPGAIITGHRENPNKTKLELPSGPDERDSIPGETYLEEVTDFSKVKPIDAQEWKCPKEKPKDGEKEKPKGEAATLQRSAKSSDMPDTVPPVVHEVLNSPGRPLDADTRALMESHFGQDFGHVRIHADARADAAATSVNAQAYTVGRDVVFQAGEYRPETTAGRKLLAHELAHTIQQGARKFSPAADLKLGHPADASEREANGASRSLGEAGRVNVYARTSGIVSRQTPAAQTGLGAAVKEAVEKVKTAMSYETLFAQLNGMEIGTLLDKLAELKKLGKLDGMFENFESAKGVHRERLFMAMKAVELQGTVKRDQFAALFFTQIQKIKELDQREKILSYVAKGAKPDTDKDKAKGEGSKGAAQTGEPISADKLSAMGTAEQTTFKRAVYNAQMANSKRAKSFSPGVPAADLEKVEGGHRLHKDAAPDARNLLAKAREDLKAEQDAQGELAMKVTSIGVGSSYRDPQEDFKIWDGLFQQYYGETQKKRDDMEGGEHGPKAIAYTAGYISGKKAVPGFSNHTTGTALDFVTKEGKDSLGANTSQNDRWKKAWLHIWLVKNAATYNFHPLATEAFHWNHEAKKSNAE